VWKRGSSQNPPLAVRREFQRGLVEAPTPTDTEFGCYFQPTPSGGGRGELHSPAGAVSPQTAKPRATVRGVLHLAAIVEVAGLEPYPDLLYNAAMAGSTVLSVTFLWALFSADTEG